MTSEQKKLYEKLDKCKEWWDLSRVSKPLFHHLCSLVCAQEVAFATGRKIRSKLYAGTLDGIVTREYILEHKNLASTGLSPLRCRTLLDLARLETKDVSVEKQLQLYCQVDGIGEWTRKGASLLCAVGGNVILTEDKWIRKRLTEYSGGKKLITIAQGHKIFEKEWKGYESMMSMVLWRLQAWGVPKLKNDEAFIREDFV